MSTRSSNADTQAIAVIKAPEDVVLTSEVGPDDRPRRMPFGTGATLQLTIALVFITGCALACLLGAIPGVKPLQNEAKPEVSHSQTTDTESSDKKPEKEQLPSPVNPAPTADVVVPATVRNDTADKPEKTDSPSSTPSATTSETATPSPAMPSQPSSAPATTASAPPVSPTPVEESSAPVTQAPTAEAPQTQAPSPQGTASPDAVTP